MLQYAGLTRKGEDAMSQDEKLDKLLEEVSALKQQMDKQDEQIAYIVARLEHMRDKAHENREKQTAWPK